MTLTDERLGNVLREVGERIAELSTAFAAAARNAGAALGRMTAALRAASPGPITERRVDRARRQRIATMMRRRERRAVRRAKVAARRQVCG